MHIHSPIFRAHSFLFLLVVSLVNLKFGGGGGGYGAVEEVL